MTRRHSNEQSMAEAPRSRLLAADLCAISLTSPRKCARVNYRVRTIRSRERPRWRMLQSLELWEAEWDVRVSEQTGVNLTCEHAGYRRRDAAIPFLQNKKDGVRNRCRSVKQHKLCWASALTCGKQIQREKSLWSRLLLQRRNQDVAYMHSSVRLGSHRAVPSADRDSVPPVGPATPRQAEGSAELVARAAPSVPRGCSVSLEESQAGRYCLPACLPACLLMLYLPIK